MGLDIYLTRFDADMDTVLAAERRYHERCDAEVYCDDGPESSEERTAACQKIAAELGLDPDGDHPAKPWTGKDRGAGAVAGSWLKHRETIDEPGTRLACLNATLDDLAGRGIADGSAYIRGVENHLIRQREEAALREAEGGTVLTMRRPSQAAGLAPTGTGGRP